MKEKLVFCWSGGKDSAFALYEIMKDERYEVVSLLTTVTEGYDRISVHGIRRELLEAQAESIGLPLHKVYIAQKSSNEDYEEKMKDATLYFKSQGVNTVGFGDIFLEDLKKYREDNLAKVGMKAVFPIWGRKTSELIKEFVDVGFKAALSCVDGEVLDGSFSGKIIDESFAADLPENVDPCGENGEYHSFVFAGPIFKREIPFKFGERVLREERFYYCDFLAE
jgi:uncharacterized protein (TIGR00290 family)